MGLRNLMELNFSEAKEKLAHCICGIWEGSRTIIITDSPDDVGYFAQSDIILVFSPEGEMVLATERIKEKRVGFFKFRRYLKKAKQYIENDEVGIDVAVTRGDGFVDITAYKVWWHEWAKSLTEPIDI